MALPSNASAPAAVLAVAEQAAAVWQVEGAGAALGDRVGLLPARSHALGGGEWLVLVPIEQQFGYVTLRVRVAADGRVAEAREVAGLPELEVARMPRGLREEEVRIGALGGTVTWPAGSARVPGVVLIAGSGPQDRDGTVGPNRPFMDLAWGLAAAGIAVLRYDKRSFRLGHSDTLADEAADAVAALATLAALERVDRDHVFLLGHSLGGVVATRAAGGMRVAGIILAAAPARPLEEALLEQVAYLVRWRGGDDAAVSAELARQRAAIAATREAFWLEVRAHTVAEALQRPRAQPALPGRAGRARLPDHPGRRAALARAAGAQTVRVSAVSGARPPADARPRHGHAEIVWRARARRAPPDRRRRHLGAYALAPLGCDGAGHSMTESVTARGLCLP